MKLRGSTGVTAGLLSLALLAAGPAAAADPAQVRVRVEGTDATLVPRTTVSTFAGTFAKDGNPAHGCPGTSALGALERATGGDWSGTYDTTFASWLVETIRGETHTAPPLADPAPFWSFWINDRVATAGLCDTELQAGDDVLLFPDCYGSRCPGPSPTPLRVTAPARAAPGVPVRVSVVALTVGAGWPPQTTPMPAAGAAVTAGGQTVTTGADGTAQVTFDAAGAHTVQAAKAAHVRSATETVCVTTGADGVCGSRPVPPAGTGVAGHVAHGPVTTIAGIRDGARFARRRAPRTLHGTATAGGSRLRAVKLRLTRQLGRRCWKYSGRAERFISRRCGTRSWFAIGDRQRWSYLLPARLKRGRYVLDATALNAERRRDPLERGRNRVVFRVS